MITPVGVTSADYTQAIRNGNPTHIRIVFPVQNRTFTDEHILSDSGITLTTIMNPDVDLTMGKAIATEIVINFINSADLSGLDWTEEFRFDMGVEISETTYWVTVGYFKGSRPENVIYTDIISFIAYDRMTNFDILADDFVDSLSFPCTIQDIFEGLCDFVGFDHTTDIEAGDENSTTMAATIDENPFDYGITCRTILAWVAEINCCYAVFTNEGKIKLKWFSDETAYEIPQDFQFDVKINEYQTVPALATWGDLANMKWSSLASKKWGELAGVDKPSFAVAALRMAITEFNTYFQYPSNYAGKTGIYTIIDNPLMLNNGDATPPDISRIYNRLKGIGLYTPASVNTVGNWLVETGDIITVIYGDDDTEIVLPIFNRTLTWTGAAMDTYECTSSLDRPALTENYMTQFKEGGRFHKFILGLANKYDVINGIAIDDNGIEVVGNKYVKIRSGGSFEVDSENFKVDSVNKLAQSGDWRMTDDGFTGIWEDSNGNDRVFSIRKNLNSLTIPDDVKNCPGGVLMYTLPTGANADVETFYITLAYPNVNQTVSRPNVSIWRNGYFMFKMLRSAVYYWLVQGGGTMPTEWTMEKVFYCDSIGSPDKSSGRIGSGFFANLYIENIEPYTLDEAEGIYYPTTSITKGHVGTSYHWFAHAYLYYVYYNTLVQNSSRDIKHDIKALPSVGDQLDKLEPVTFKYNNDPEEKTRYGLVYEDTVGVMPDICSENEGQKAINYTELIPMLLKEIQDLRARVKQLEDMVK